MNRQPSTTSPYYPAVCPHGTLSFIKGTAPLHVQPLRRRVVKSKSTMNQTNLSSFIWSVADLLRGDYKQSDYGKVILPFTVLRRLDCVLEGTKDAVLKEKEKRETAGLNPEPFLLKKSKQLFFNTSPLDMKKLMGDQGNIAENMYSYIQAFSPAVRDIFECFDFHTQIERLGKAGLLYLVAEKFVDIDLHPETVSNAQMGTVFEELIRKFAELSNETAGEHMSPRDVIRLMVNLLFIEDDDLLCKPGIVRSLYDPTVATGGMLSVAEEHLAELNPDARLVMYGQELNAESYAICKAEHRRGKVQLIDASSMWQKMRNTLDLVGMAAFVQNVRSRLLLCDLVYRFRAKEDAFDPAFLVHSLRSKNVRSQIECNAVGSSATMKKVSQELVRNLFVCQPPLKEQQDISKQLATMSGAFDSLEAEATRAIDLLQERRTALISAAVTGKIDVRKFSSVEAA